MIILLMGMLFAPGGYLYAPVEGLAHSILGVDAVQSAVEVFSSRVVFFTLFVVAFIAWTIQRQLDESAEFEATKEAAKEKGEDTGVLHSFSLLLSNKVARMSVMFLAAIYLTWNLVARLVGRL